HVQLSLAPRPAGREVQPRILFDVGETHELQRIAPVDLGRKLGEISLRIGADLYRRITRDINRVVLSEHMLPSINCDLCLSRKANQPNLALPGRKRLACS